MLMLSSILNKYHIKVLKLYKCGIIFNLSRLKIINTHNSPQTPNYRSNIFTQTHTHINEHTNTHTTTHIHKHCKHTYKNFKMKLVNNLYYWKT